MTHLIQNEMNRDDVNVIRKQSTQTPSCLVFIRNLITTPRNGRNGLTNYRENHQLYCVSKPDTANRTHTYIAWVVMKVSVAKLVAYQKLSNTFY